MKTYTPELDPGVLDRLRDYAALFAEDFPQAKPARWAGVYLQGLLLDGERKSIEPLSRRITLPDGLTSTDPEQALQQFVNQSPWDEKAVLKRYRAHLAQTFASPEGIFLFDDVSFPKQGTHSVGVKPDAAVFTEKPTWDRPDAGPSGGRGRPRKQPRLTATSPRPVPLSTLAEQVTRQRVNWREGTQGMLSGHFAWVRVWPGQGW